MAQITSSEKAFIGVDIGKEEFFAFSVSLGSSPAFTNNQVGFEQFIEWLSPLPENTLIAFEATGGYEWALWQYLSEKEYTARQISPIHVRAYARAHGHIAKNDYIDARTIAGFIAFRPDAGRNIPSEKLFHIKALVQKRSQLVEHKKRLKCQIDHEFSDKFKTMNETMMTMLEQHIKEINAFLESAIKEDEALERQAEILRSIPGIGPVLCATLLAHMPELGHCSDKQIAALAGVAPMDRQSGAYQGRKTIFGGRKEVRTVLYQAALVASIHNPVLNEFAKKLQEKNKPHKVKLIAIARKLITIANAMVAKNTLWKYA